MSQFFNTFNTFFNVTTFVSAIVVVTASYLYRYAVSIKISNKPVKLGFYHPYCCHGGGGERVLWTIIKCLFTSTCNNRLFEVVIYTGDVYQSKDDVFLIIQNQFKIEFTEEMKKKIRFQVVKTRILLDPKLYPFATMIFQSLASVLVAMECILLERPHIFIDTMGGAFCYPFVRYLGWCYVIAYVHYPIISTDMLKAVREQRPSYNNKAIISSNVTVSAIKLLYYRAFAFCYSAVGYCVDLVIVNSSWTEGHIRELWHFPENFDGGSIVNVSGDRRLVKIYPPCNTAHLLNIPLNSAKMARQMKILSVGQFRPEKDHMLQLKAFHRCIRNYVCDESRDDDVNCNRTDRLRKYDDVRLILVGSSRNKDDEELLTSLRRAAEELKISQYVEFVVNAPYSTLLQLYSTCGVGIHTMWNEHFGISIVEMMAAGVIVVAHRSGGPKQDILLPLSHCDGDACTVEKVGYLAETPEEYAECLSKALDQLQSSSDAYFNMQQAARQSTIERFSDNAFDTQIADGFQHIFNLIPSYPS